MKKRFAELIHDLGEELETQLDTDQLGTCSLVVDEKFTVQLEPDKYTDQVLMGTSLTNVAPGKFRENVLAQALKANGIYPRPGIFAFRAESSELVLFTMLSIEGLDAKKIVDTLALFIDTAETWKQAIDNGNLVSLGIAPGSKTASNTKQQNPFNIK